MEDFIWVFVAPVAMFAIAYSLWQLDSVPF